MTKRLLITALIAAMSGSVLSAATPPSKISKDLQNLSPMTMVDVVIQWRTAPTAAFLNKVHLQGGLDKVLLPLVNGGAFHLPSFALNILALDPDIVYISADRPHKGLMNITAPTVNAPVAWQQGFLGTGVGVAVIDSGITPVDLGNRMVYSEAFGGLTSTDDGFGHGTHVAGIVGSSGLASNGVYKGIAPNVNIINLRVLDNDGSGTDSAVIARS